MADGYPEDEGVFFPFPFSLRIFFVIATPLLVVSVAYTAYNLVRILPDLNPSSAPIAALYILLLTVLSLVLVVAFIPMLPNIVRRSGLWINRRGLSYDLLPAMRISIRWEDVDRIAPFGALYGVYVTHARVQGSFFWRWLYVYYFDAGYPVTLSVFAAWKTGELQAELDRYIRHLWVEG